MDEGITGMLNILEHCERLIEFTVWYFCFRLKKEKKLYGLFAILCTQILRGKILSDI